MNLPFVKRIRFDAACAQADLLGKAVERLQNERNEKNSEIAVLRAMVELLQKSIAGHEDDRRKFLDRIAQLSGQPPIYEKQPAQSAQPTQDLPEVPQKLTIDDIHKAARKAMADGTFDLPRGRAI